jgi:Family of unknown function (DUF6161)
MAESKAKESQEALFTLDLGANGGTFSPKSLEDIAQWIQREIDAWSWVIGSRDGEHRTTVVAALQPVIDAKTSLDASIQRAKSAPASVDFAGIAGSIRERLDSIYRSQRFVHSTSQAGKRALAIKEVSSRGATGYLFAFLAPPNQEAPRFAASDLRSWHGFMQGLTERFGHFDGKDQLAAQRKLFDELHAQLNTLIGDKATALEALQSRFDNTANDLARRLGQQDEEFRALIEAQAKAHAKLMEDHGTQMENLRKAYKEDMKLRGSISYWTTRGNQHVELTRTFAKRSWQALLALSVVVSLGAWVIGATTPADKPPEWWKLAVLGLVGVCGVWGVRLVVRMYLSHQHLATDADERVTMAQTYLALVAEGMLTNDDERRIVLQPLFRPAVDGIVKDEGVPHPILEVLTRSGKPQG